MARNRTGARSFLDISKKACKLSHTPGFTSGIVQILGPETAAPILSAWSLFCGLIETAIAADDFFNKIDFTAPNLPDSEDSIPRGA